MYKFYWIEYQGNQLLGLNTVRKYEHFIHVLDMVKCNVQCIDPFSLSDEQIPSTRHIFSREEPPMLISLYGVMPYLPSAKGKT
jgi:hypothetical protein